MYSINPHAHRANRLAHRFSTKPKESFGEFYYYGYRFYDAGLGRWLNRDPIQERGGVNLYGFVGNDGVNRWDYLGMKFGYTNGAVGSYYQNRNDGMPGPHPLRDLIKLVAGNTDLDRRLVDYLFDGDGRTQIEPIDDVIISKKSLFFKRGTI